MKNYLQRSIAFCLILACAVSIIPAASAAHKTVTEDEQVSRSQEIELRREELYDFLKMQLDAQNAGEYIDQFSYLVDMTIQQEYYPATYANSERVYAPHGGWVYSDTMNYTRECEYLNAEDTQTLYNNRGSSLERFIVSLSSIGINTAWDEIKKSIVALKGVSDVAAPYLLVHSLAMLCVEYLNDAMWEKINIGTDGCVISSVYDKLELRRINVFWPWTDLPYIDTSIYPASETHTVVEREVED